MNASHLSLDTVFDLLANRRRRYVLYYLAAAEDEQVLKLEDIAGQVEAWEREWDTAETPETTDRQERIRIDLHHNHLPRLAAAGLIDYDGRTETIRNWDTPSVERWAENEEQELPRLRALFGRGGTDRRDPS